jgi:hypothetical protein
MDYRVKPGNDENKIGNPRTCRLEPFVVRSPAPRQGGDDPMAFEDLKAEIALLFSQMENQPEDRHELYLQIREKLNEMRAFDLPLPDDLVRLEKELEAEFRAEERTAKKH